MKRVLLLVMLCGAPLIAQTGLTIPANMETAMTAQQRKAAGLDKLTASQKQAFDGWLQRYALDTVNKVWRTSQDSAVRQISDEMQKTIKESDDQLSMDSKRIASAKSHTISGIDEHGHHITCVADAEGFAQCFGD